MNNTLDKKGVISPFASRQNIGMIDVRDENHPVKEEVKGCVVIVIQSR
jgi:hypothetical protein